jgi:DNA polymerase-3 subunit gamma/tau
MPVLIDDTPPPAAPAAAGYRVLALKYRPQTFDDLLGQDHIKLALTNAITRNKVAHAFLFAGSRGTGKTTTARILAKALNCLSSPGATPTPCGTCVACREIAESRDMDVLEIDGASNNGVEQIRELKSGIDNKPARDRCRVIIIDEVHMLSIAAFNALLKTLEEPPAHVKFIFATTDPHKVPETIHSRCQHYDFRRLTGAEIAGSLRAICAREEITITDELPEAIAAICDGGMRDAQSKLDQLIAFRGTSPAVADLEQVFGLVSRSGLLELVAAFRQSDRKRALEFVESLFASGKDLGAFCGALMRLLRDVLIVKTCGGDFRGLDLVPGEAEKLAAEGTCWTQDQLVTALDILSQASARLKQTDFPRYILETAVIRLCDVPSLRPVSQMIASLDALLSGHAATAAPRPAAAAPRPAAPQNASAPPPRAAAPAYSAPAAARPAPAPAAPTPAAAPAASASPDVQRAKRLIDEMFTRG